VACILTPAFPRPLQQGFSFLDRLSLDFSRPPLVHGRVDRLIYAKGGAPVTVHEAALIYAEGMGMPRLVGTPADIADRLGDSSIMAVQTDSCSRRHIRPVVSKNSSIL
jgi:hypothetical protein